MMIKKIRGDDMQSNMIGWLYMMKNYLMARSMFAMNIRKNLIILLGVSLLFLTGCYKDDRSQIHKYSTDIRTRTENFSLELKSSNVGKWINTNISVKKDVQLPLNVMGDMSLCKGGIINKKIDAIACGDFSSPTYPTYNETSDIAKSFKLDPVKACARSQTFSNTMQYTDTDIDVLKGDLISFSLEPQRVVINNCMNTPTSITFEDTTNSLGHKINSKKFCNDYLSTLPANANVFQAYVNNELGPEGNKVMLRDDSRIVYISSSVDPVTGQPDKSMKKEITYVIPNVYINYFDNTDAILNFVVAPSYTPSSPIDYILNSNHKFQYYSDIYVASNISSPNIYYYDFDGISHGLNHINQLIKNIFPISDSVIHISNELYNLFYNGYLSKLAYFAHDYQKLLTDRAGMTISRDRDLYQRVHNVKYSYFTSLRPTKTNNEMLRDSGKNSGADIEISKLKTMRKAIFKYLNDNKTVNGVKIKREYVKFSFNMPQGEINAIPQTLNAFRGYKHKGVNTDFDDIFKINKNVCTHNYVGANVDDFLKQLKNKIRFSLNSLIINGVDVFDLYYWQDFEAKLSTLKTLREHEFFCYDAADGQKFDHAVTMQEIKTAYVRFVESLKKREFTIDKMSLNSKSLDLYPFWLRSNLLDFRDFYETKKSLTSTSRCNLIRSMNDPRKKFDVFSLNSACGNVCKTATQKNCVHTMVVRPNVSNASGGVQLFSNAYQYDKNGAYNVIADHLVAKIATNGKIEHGSTGKCVANDNSGKCAADFTNSFVDSIRLNKEYVVNEDGRLMLIVADDEMGYGKNYGGYNVNIKHSCSFSNGKGVYYYTGDSADVTGKSLKDLSAKSLSSALNEEGIGQIMPEKDGHLFVYIPARNGITTAYSGQYNIQTTSEANNTPISNLLMPIFNSFEKTLYGERNSEGKYDHTKPGIVKRFYQGFMVQSGFSRLLQALLVLYVAFTAFGYLTGVLEAKNADVLMRLVKMSVITILTSGASWDFFNETLYSLIRDGSKLLVEAIMTNSGYIQGQPFAIYDRIGNIILAEQTWERIGLMFGIFPAGFIAFWFLLGVMLDIFVFLFKGLIIYFSSVFVASILLGFAPIFIPFIMFSLTRKVFDGWMKQLMSYVLIPVFYFASISMTVTILITLLRQIFNFDYVIDCALWFEPGPFVAATGGVAWVAIFIPRHCIYYWPKIAQYYTSYGGLPYQFTQIIALYAFTKVFGKVINLSKTLAASIIGFLPTGGSVAELGDNVTGGMEKAVGLDGESKKRRETASNKFSAREKQIKQYMNHRAETHTDMNQFFNKNKDAKINDFAKELKGEKGFDKNQEAGAHKQELWDQYKDHNNIKDDRNFDDYCNESAIYDNDKPRR